MAGVIYIFAPSSIRPIDEVITFTGSLVRKLSMPHEDALVITLEVRKHLMKLILVDPSSATDLLYLLARLCLSDKQDNLRNLGSVLVGFNELQSKSLGEMVLLVTAGLVISLVPLTVVDEPSSFNIILRHTWINAMKTLSSYYHQILSFQTLMGQIDI